MTIWPVVNQNKSIPSEPLISIVTIAFNAGRYIEATARSIVSQDYTNLECILIDGGSTDETIEKYRSILGRRATVYSEKDDGIYDAMNRGALRARGDFILFLHADDAFVDSASLGRLVAALPPERKAWVCGFYLVRNGRDEVVKKEATVDFTFRDMLRANQIRHQTALVPLAWVRDVPFRKEFKYAMDYDHFLHIWKRFGPPIILKEHIAFFRFDGTNMSSQLEASLKDELAVRLAFRKEQGQILASIFDRLIFILRWLKIKLYYRRLFRSSLERQE